MQYSQPVAREKLLGQEQVDGMRNTVRTRLGEVSMRQRRVVKQYVFEEFAEVPAPSRFTNPFPPRRLILHAEDRLKPVLGFPEGFHLNPKLKVLVDRRREDF